MPTGQHSTTAALDGGWHERRDDALAPVAAAEVLRSPAPVRRRSGTQAHWSRSSSLYQVYLRSFADGNGDGIGDLHGLHDRLDYIADLGVDGLWVTPFFESPMIDGGYDVSDYRQVDPLFGDVALVEALIDGAHARGLRFVMEVIPNHVSAEHVWFREAIASADSPARKLFHFHDGAPGGGVPNNWKSVFGGPAWTIEPSGGQYYLHLFDPQMPDLNWDHPLVREDFLETLRFWLDKGVDGFRIDVAHGLFKERSYADNPSGTGRLAGVILRGSEERHSWNQPAVHDVYRNWRRIVDAYAHQPVLLGEVGLRDPVEMAAYVRPDELHLAFSFLMMHTGWDAAGVVAAVEASLRSMRDVGALPTWVLSNHDKPRAATRMGGGELGRRRAAALSLLVMALPGACIVYNGEELGIEDRAVEPTERLDPQAVSRDGCRVPLPWTSEAPGFGFSAARPWLTIPTEWSDLCVQAQQHDPGSVLKAFQKGLTLRRELALSRDDGITWVEQSESVVAFGRDLDDGTVYSITNFSDGAVDLPRGEVLHSSSPLADGRLPGCTTAWVRSSAW